MKEKSLIIVSFLIDYELLEIFIRLVTLWFGLYADETEFAEVLHIRLEVLLGIFMENKFQHFF